LAYDSEHGKLWQDIKADLDKLKDRASKFADDAEWAFARRTARVLGVIMLFAVAVALLFLLLNSFIEPSDGKEKQGLALVLAISLGGIAAVVGLYFTQQTLLTTRELEEDRAREAALRACLEQLGRLLTHKKWSTNDLPGDTDNNLRNLARAEALSVLGTLDGPRKRILVRFLYESQLLKDPKVDLSGPDLREAHLKRLDLTNASLCDVRLMGADLSGTTLVGSNLSGSDLRSNLWYSYSLQPALRCYQ
jgi:hypothetical protein